MPSNDDDGLSNFLDNNVVKWAVSTSCANKSQIRDCSMLLILFAELSGQREQHETASDVTVTEDHISVRFANLMRWMQCMRRYIEVHLNEFMIGPLPNIHSLSVDFPREPSLSEYMECLLISLYCFKPNCKTIMNAAPKCMFRSKCQSDDEQEILVHLNELHIDRYFECMYEKHRRWLDGAKWTSTIRQMESDIEQKQGELLDSNMRIEKLEEELSRTEQKLEEVVEEAERLHLKTDDIDALAEKAARVHHLETKLSRFQSLITQNDQLSKDLNCLTKQLTTTKQENSCLRNRVSDLLDHIKNRSSNEAECLLLRNKVQKLETHLREKSHVIASLSHKECLSNYRPSECDCSDHSNLYMSLDEQVEELSLTEKTSFRTSSISSRRKSSDSNSVSSCSRVYEKLGCL